MSDARIPRPTATIVAELDEMLLRAGDPGRAVQEKAYLKSPIDHYGASVPAIRRAVKMMVPGVLEHDELLRLVHLLWSSPVHEQRMAAVILLEERAAALEPDDLLLIEEMIRASFTWAYVDTLATSVAGPLIERDPGLAARLDRWAVDDCFWVRRAAMLALLLALRRGEGDWKRFTRYADRMLAETEFFIRKAIGWVLRDTSKKRPALVRRYVASRLDRLSGLTFREAVRRLPESDRLELKRAYEARKPRTRR
jgi:3-methyladenine DNA glycosylase AlkD